MLNRLVGKENESEIVIEGVKSKALIDTGSMVSTVAEDFLNALDPVPIVHNIEELGLKVNAANGQTLPYSGYVEVEVTVSYLQNSALTVPLLVVPMTDYNREVPVIVGTNIIRLYKITCDGSDAVPAEWKTAFSSICSDRVGVVKTTKKLTLKPNESRTVTGLVRKNRNAESALTSPIDEDGLSSKLTICPRVVRADKPGTTTRVPVRVCNLSAKVVDILPNTNICSLEEVKVLKRDPVKDVTENIKYTAEQHQQTATTTENKLNINLDGSALTNDQKQQVQRFLSKWQHVFSQSPTDLGRTNLVEHEIHLENEQPFKEPYRKIPPALVDEVREHLKEMLEVGAIRESTSPFSSNVVIVRKKDGSIRFCIDYRKLNQRTIKDAYAIPRIDDTLHSLAGSKYFTTLDLKSGYWQVEMKEADKAKTAFQVGPLGFFECNRMPFGLCNAPATFQRLMERCMGDLNLRECLIYLDDIIIFSSTFEEHLERLNAVFKNLEVHNLKLKPSKCEFFKSRVVYLGHVVSEDGIHTDPAKTEAVRNWPIPRCTKDVRKFLGFTGYYRRFIEGYAAIARPLNDLLIGHSTNPGAKKKSSVTATPFEWGTEQQKSFETIVRRLTNPPVLGYADYRLPFSLHTDASGSGLGAALYQRQNGVNRVIAYASRSLKPAEKNYPAHKLEFLALKWAVCEKFHDYLYGTKFEAITDNNPLTYVFTTAKLDATGQRWIAALSNYNFDIKYRSGKKNADADGLSRLREEEDQHDVVFPDVLKAISFAAQVVSDNCPLVESLALSDTALSAGSPLEVPEQLLQTSALSDRDWRKAQRQDPTLEYIIKCLQTGASKPVPQILASTTYNRRYLKDWDKLYLCGEILYRRGTVGSQEFQQLVVPLSYRDEIFKALHSDLGHQGRDRTVSLIKQRFFWPGIDSFVKENVSQCDRCIRRKTKTDKSAELVNIVSTMPMEIVCLDYLSLERSKGGFENVLVITDHFSRYAQAFPTKNQTAKTTARILFDQFIVHYGFPARIHSDQGQTFESNLIKELCSIAEVEKSRTTPYHAMGNGQVERFNQTLLQMLGTLEEYQKSDWKAHVPTLVHAYNATIHDSTGYSPYFLMFGRHPRLPIDAFLGLSPDAMSAKHQTEYARKLRERLAFAYRTAQKTAQKMAAKHKANYDLHVRPSGLEPGDRVLVRNVGLRGKHKLADRWERQPYIVKAQPNPDIPVYEVQLEAAKTRKTRILHRNLLLPISSLPPSPLKRRIPSVASYSPASDATDFQSTVGELPQMETEVLYSRAVDENSDLEYDASISSCSQGDETETIPVPRYIIPMKRKPGQPGLNPRTATSPATSESSSTNSPQRQRPQRSRKRPVWMKSPDWVLSHVSTAVNPKAK